MASDFSFFHHLISSPINRQMVQATEIQEKQIKRDQSEETEKKIESGEILIERDALNWGNHNRVSVIEKI